MRVHIVSDASEVRSMRHATPATPAGLGRTIRTALSATVVTVSIGFAILAPTLGASSLATLTTARRDVAPVTRVVRPFPTCPGTAIPCVRQRL